MKYNISFLQLSKYHNGLPKLANNVSGSPVRKRRTGELAYSIYRKKEKPEQKEALTGNRETPQTAPVTEITFDRNCAQLAVLEICQTSLVL